MNPENEERFKRFKAYFSIKRSRKNIPAVLFKLTGSRRLCGCGSGAGGNGASVYGFRKQYISKDFLLLFFHYRYDFQTYGKCGGGDRSGPLAEYLLRRGGADIFPALSGLQEDISAGEGGLLQPAFVFLP